MPCNKNINDRQLVCRYQKALNNTAINHNSAIISRTLLILD